MKRYKCKKSFCVDYYDDDGFLENSSIVIEKDKVYELDQSGYMIIGGRNHIHLDSIDDGSWLEIPKDDLKEYFEEIKSIWKK